MNAATRWQLIYPLLLAAVTGALLVALECLPLRQGALALATWLVLLACYVVASRRCEPRR